MIISCVLVVVLPSSRPSSSGCERSEGAPVSRTQWLCHPSTPAPCWVRGIAFVNQLTGVLTTAFRANEYLDFDIKGWNLCLRTFEE